MSKAPVGRMGGNLEPFRRNATLLKVRVLSNRFSRIVPFRRQGISQIDMIFAKKPQFCQPEHIFQLPFSRRNLRSDPSNDGTGQRHSHRRIGRNSDQPFRKEPIP